MNTKTKQAVINLENDVFRALLDLSFFGSIKIDLIGDTVDKFYRVTIVDLLDNEIVTVDNLLMASAIIEARDQTVAYYLHN